VIKSHPEFKSVRVSDRANDRAGILENIQDISNIDDVKALVYYFINEVSDRANDRVNDIVSDRVNDIVSDIVNDKVGDKVRKVLEGCLVSLLRENVLNVINLKNHPGNYNRYIKPLIETGWLEMTDPDNPTNPNQKYRTTERGKILMQIISRNKDAGK